MPDPKSRLMFSVLSSVIWNIFLYFNIQLLRHTISLEDNEAYITITTIILMWLFD